MKKTSMMKRHLLEFTLRLIVFIAVFVIYLYDREMMYNLITKPLVMGISPLNLLWVVFMGLMISHLFPAARDTMALRKAEMQDYVPVENYSEEKLMRFVQEQNVKAWQVMLVWLFGNGVIGLLYLIGVLSAPDLVMITVFYFLGDMICIVFFCPFQTGIMKNKCCVNCRIYDWGHFMMFTPMLFIKNFFSWSLFFTSAVVLIHWEIIYAKHPEQFWEGSNQNLQCAHCKDKLCRVKKAVKRKFFPG